MQLRNRNTGLAIGKRCAPRLRIAIAHRKRARSVRSEFNFGLETSEVFHASLADYGRSEDSMDHQDDTSHRSSAPGVFRAGRDGCLGF